VSTTKFWSVINQAKVIQNNEASFEQFVLQIFPGENINNIKAALDKECGDGKGVLAFRNTMTQIIHQKTPTFIKRLLK